MANTHCIPFTFLLLVMLASGVEAGQQSSATTQTGWDNTVNSLLATGMYGFNSVAVPGLTVQLQRADNLTLVGPNLSAITPSGQALTFSYEGSSGLLEFSAGYILTTQNGNEEPGAVFLGLDSGPGQTFDPGRSWYLALDLSRSYQVDEHLSFSLGNRAMLLNNPFDTKAGHFFSLLFNMPISYKNYLTITPELQWSRPVTAADSLSNPVTSGKAGEQSSSDAFYGGVSVRFSY